GAVDLHAKIVVRMDGKRVDTTVGRTLLWEIIPKASVLSMRHIMVDTEDEAISVLDRIRGGAVFTDMVKQYSKSPDREDKGGIGLLRKDEFQRIFPVNEEVVEAVFALEQGEISDIVCADEAYHLFEVVSR